MREPTVYDAYNTLHYDVEMHREPTIYDTANFKWYLDSIGLVDSQTKMVLIYKMHLTRWCLIIGTVAGIIIGRIV